MLTLNCFCWCLYTKKVRVVHSQLANECLMVSYRFLPSILQVWVAEGWQVCTVRDHCLLIISAYWVNFHLEGSALSTVY